MKRFTMVFAIALLAAVLGAIPVFAASSGNFSATGTSASCVICNGVTNNTNPACSGVGVGQFGGGTTLTSFTADITTSNGNGVTLDIRPDLVTGLFTDTKISTTVSTATAEVGIQVCVTVDGSGDGVKPTPCVIYNERFQQLSSGLFSQLTACTAAPTGTACSTNSISCTAGCPAGGACTCQLGTTGFCTTNTGTACASNATCNAITAGDTCNFAGICVGPNPSCNIELLLSTLSANSFDFVVSMPGVGPHVVEAAWSVVDVVNNGNSTPVAACVGPGILTVTQYKVFQNSGALTFGSL